MTRAEKAATIEALKEKFDTNSFFYLTDSSALTVEQVNNFRRLCFEKGIEMKVVKNTLAQKAMQTIDNLCSGALRYQLDDVGKPTKHGEKRIKTCRKYDLGSGHRLITLHHKNTVFISFLGSHDECQRWLGKNHRVNVFTNAKGRKVRISQSKKPTSIPDVLPPNSESEPAAEMPAKLSDSDLRSVFGFLGAAPKSKT